jgi:hypothetical protein
VDVAQLKPPLELAWMTSVVGVAQLVCGRSREGKAGAVVAVQVNAPARSRSPWLRRGRSAGFRAIL